MKQLLYFIIVLFAAISTQAVAQEAPIFPKGEKVPNVNHVGNVWLHELSEPDSTFNYSISVATFDPGARLNWHKPAGWANFIDYGRHWLLSGKREA